ncbi:MAG: hypothetical protein ACRD9S_19920 [Pyrinomonadaceae bacterium]
MISIIAILLVLMTPQHNCDEAPLQKLTRDAEVIVVAQVVEVQPTGLPLEIWSGPVLSTQNVRFKVKGVLKGNINECDITVSFALAYKTNTADEKHARLSPQLFAEGKILLLFLKKNSEQKLSPSTVGYRSIDSNCGAVEESPHLLEP